MIPASISSSGRNRVSALGLDTATVATERARKAHLDKSETKEFRNNAVQGAMMAGELAASFARCGQAASAHGGSGDWHARTAAHKIQRQMATLAIWRTGAGDGAAGPWPNESSIWESPWQGCGASASCSASSLPIRVSREKRASKVSPST